MRNKNCKKKNGRNRLDLSGNNNYAIYNNNNSHFSEQLLYGRSVVFGVSTQESAVYYIIYIIIIFNAQYPYTSTVTIIFLSLLVPSL